MNNLINVLEEISTLPSFTSSRHEVQNLVERADLAEDVKEAILSDNHLKLDWILGDKHKIVCVLVPAKEDDDEEKQDDDQDEDKEEKSKLFAINM